MQLQPAEQRRRRQREETRRAILDAAEALLVEDGYEGFSMRRVAERCGYTTPSIYHHFQDKQGLINALLEARFDELLRRMQRVPQGDDPLENWRRMTLAFVHFGLENPAHYRLLMTPRDRNDPPLPIAEQTLELMQRPVAELEASGRLIPSQFEAARQAAWAMIHGLISLQTGRPDYEWSSELVTTAVDLLSRGLFQEPGANGAAS